MSTSPHIYIALPILNESANINSLLDCLRKQDFTNFTLVACVNQYDSWWNDKKKLDDCNDNIKSIELLTQLQPFEIKVIDRSTQGAGWPDKKGGVGWARKTIMDYISSKANKNDVIVSIDADTYYPEDYLSSISKYFIQNKDICGLSLPYYHKLNRDITDRLILRYEIYMRYYSLNMMRIRNPYCFTALGSAMAFPVWAYKKAGGLTPVASGEDFYFLQKLVKIGKLGIWTSTIAYPSSRFSSRVLFGTGPALIKGNTGNWSSYPHYHYKLFDEIYNSYGMFGNLFSKELETPVDSFLKEQTKSNDIWSPLRNNYKDEKNFVRACVNKVDGLRILQFLRKQQSVIDMTNEEIIYQYVFVYYKNKIDNELLQQIKEFNYANSSVELLNKLRDFLFNAEMELRKNMFVTTDGNNTL